MPRLFAGLELPEDLCEDLSDLRFPLAGTRWRAAEDLHLTLRFAGDIEKRQAEDWAGYLEDIDIGAFPLKLKGLGVFTEKDPRTLFVGVEPNRALDELQRATEKAARHAGLPPEGRSFRPHVTLARLRNPPMERLARILQKHARYESEPLFVTHFCLFSAKPGVGGGPYVVEETFGLRGGY